jgi:hypothetical protein
MGLFDFMRKEPAPQVINPPVSGGDIIDTINMRNIELPMPKEHKGWDWVLFGNNHQFPMDLIEYRNSSSIHSSIIESKTSLISGQGFIFGGDRSTTGQFIIDNWKLVPFWRKLDKVFYQVTKDQQTFGYSCFEIIYSMDRTRIADINWLDASRVAQGKKDEFGQINKFYYSADWKNTRQNPPREIDAYDPNGEALRQLVWIQYEDNAMDYYAKPNYYSALRWIKADYLMSEYNLAAINNGFSPSIVFKFYKKPTPEERRLNAEAIKSQHGGPKNAGKAIILYADGKDLAPDIDTLDATNIDSRLITVSEQIIQNIITAHRINPTLCGINIPGKLGYSNEMLQSWSIFNALVIRPERKLILDAFKSSLVYNGISNVDIEELVPVEIVDEDINPNEF